MHRVSELLQRMTRPWSLFGGVLLAFTLFGGLVESGAVVPKFTFPGTGTSGQTYLSPVQNSSWRSWRITGVQLAGGASVRRLPDGSTVSLGTIYRGLPDFVSGRSERAVMVPFDLAGDSTVTLTLVRHGASRCAPTALQTPAELSLYDRSASRLRVSVPVGISVSTPLGQRDVGTSFVLIYGCPKS